MHYAFAVRHRNTKSFLVGAQQRSTWSSTVLQLRDPKFRAYLNEAKRAWMEIDNETDLENFYQNYREYGGEEEE
jgi:hypothetical protein